MKILVFTDLHGNKSAYRLLKKKIKLEKPDLLINCGDYTSFGYESEVLLKKLDFGIKMLTIPGNHESSQEVREAAKVFDYFIDIHKKAKRVKDVLFLGAGGGGFSEELSSLEIRESRFSDVIKKFRDKFPKGKIVLVTHTPPYGTKQDLIYDEHVGARNVRTFIRKYKIDYCFCGHIHETFGTKDKIGKTVVVNPGREGIVFEI